MHLSIALVSTWAFIYAAAIGQWREATVLVLVFVANLFLAGSRKT